MILEKATDLVFKEATLSTSPTPPASDPLSRLSDKRWRMENLYWIEGRNGKIVKFKFNFCQNVLWAALHFLNIILKARQLGMSTFIAIYFLDECLFGKNVHAAIVADKVDSGKTIFKKIDLAWRKLDPKLKEALGLTSESDSTTEVSWSNGSSIKVGTTIHSGTFQLLHISEYGPLCALYPEKAEAVKKSALPTVPPGGMIFIESTAEGEGNDFHQMCLDAMDLETRSKTTQQAVLSSLEYRFHFFPWYDEPSYVIPENVPIPARFVEYFSDLERIIKKKIEQNQRNWYVLMERSLKERMREQYPSTPDEAFLASGNKLFNQDILKAKIRAEVKEPIEAGKGYAIYANFKRGHRYGIGADVGLGIGRDSHAAVVIDFTTNEIVATFRANDIPPDVFAHDLARLGNRYGTCIVAPESNAVGHTTCVVLAQVYPNVYTHVMKGYTEDKHTTRLGWTTNQATKPRMMYDLAKAFEDDENPLLCPDSMLLREAQMYDKDDTLVTTLQAQKRMTRHFDLLIAAAIANQMRAYAAVSQSSKEQVDRIERRREAVRAGASRFH